MGPAGRIALLIAFLVSLTSADYYSDGCNEVVCKDGVNLRYPNPRDECSFCCCFRDGNLKKHGEYRVCPGNGRYDRILNRCVPSKFCARHKETLSLTLRHECSDAICPPCYDGMDYHVSNPHDSCSYCNCTESGPVKNNCPDGEEFDPVTQSCYPSSRCTPTTLPPTTTTTEPPTTTTTTTTTTEPPTTTTTTTTTTEPPTTPRDDCRDVYCPVCYEGMDYHVENPFDSCSYCDCSESGPVKKYCPYGEEFDNATQTCVPSSRCGSTTPPPDGKDGCHLVQHNCPIPEHMEYTTLFANPWDPHSYCACDWGRVHMMPCAPGTLKFDDVLKTCV